MTSNSGARGRTRDIGLSHQAGKGSANRSNSKKFRERFDLIDFGVVSVEGFVRRGNKQVKTYGKKAELIGHYTGASELCDFQPFPVPVHPMGHSVPCGTLGALGVGHRVDCDCPKNS